MKILLLALIFILTLGFFSPASAGFFQETGLSYQQQQQARHLLRLWHQEAQVIVARLQQIDMYLATHRMSRQQRNMFLMEKQELLRRLTYVHSQIQSIKAGLR